MYVIVEMLFSYFLTFEASSQCIACSSGYYADVEGSTACLVCPAHTHPNALHTECTSGMSFPWGQKQYETCQQPYSWQQIQNMPHECKTGGLGQLMTHQCESWVCLKDHSCGDPWFCFVYDEEQRAFTPWGVNSELGLVRI